MKFEELQKFIDKEHDRLASLYRDQEQKDLLDPIKIMRQKKALGRVVKLNEEVGELCEAVMCEMGLQRKAKLKKYKRSNLEDEFGDVIITTMLLAKELHIDVGNAIKKKINKIKKRKY